MSLLALEHERALRAERLISEITRRHGLRIPDPVAAELVERFFVAYVPEVRAGEPTPDLLEFAFTSTMSDALDLLRRVIIETADGAGAAIYVHDLDAGRL